MERSQLVPRANVFPSSSHLSLSHPTSIRYFRKQSSNVEQVKEGRSLETLPRSLSLTAAESVSILLVLNIFPFDDKCISELKASNQESQISLTEMFNSLYNRLVSIFSVPVFKTCFFVDLCESWHPDPSFQLPYFY